MSEAKLWPAQAKQNECAFQLVVDGNSDWKSLFNQTINLKDDFWIDLCGGQEVLLLDLLFKEAEVNNVSFERCLLNTLLNHGFQLQELDVEFWDEQKSKWGVCSWYKEHPFYETPMEGYESGHPTWTPFIRSMFRTEKAGDQEFTLFSTQMIASSLIGENRILLHKQLLYRKAVLTSPKKVVEAA